jgi:hypothetical protein
MNLNGGTNGCEANLMTSNPNCCTLNPRGMGIKKN